MSESKSWLISRPLILESLERLEQDFKEHRKQSGDEHRELREKVYQLDKRMSLMGQRIAIMGGMALFFATIAGPLLVSWIERAAFAK